MATPAATTPPPGAPVPPAGGTSADLVFGSFWPERSLGSHPRLLLAALAVGILGALVLPFRMVGVGFFGVLLALMSVVAVADRNRRAPLHLAGYGLATLLGSVTFLRSAEWVVALSLLAGFAVATATLVPARTFLAVACGWVAVPFAAIRGSAWATRSAIALRSGSASWPAVRTALVTLVLALVFGGLFASADALFASWLDPFVPDLALDTLAPRVVVLVLVAGVTLAFTYVALNPPATEAVELEAKPLTHTYEWLVPVVMVDAIFAVFVIAQVTVMFGGHDYLRRTTGLTYAEHVHQGFAQMVLATVLTLGVVGIAALKARRTTARDRLVLRAALGVLCSLALVVVASALYRLHVYEEAYGFTRLRLVVAVFEGWLGVVLLLVLTAGLALRATWLPTTAVATGAIAVLGLALSNPDAAIARHNLERYDETGKIDWSYLGGLSPDAVPVLERLTLLPEAARPCGWEPAVAADDSEDWLAWNLGRSRAGDLRAAALVPCE